ncbi:MAG: ATP-binding protein [Gammaproteobacteria bacterium]|nr:ATP-binding protein [Gammaproteobacteria bacterium]
MPDETRSNNRIQHEELLTQTQHKLIEEIEKRRKLESELRARNEELTESNTKLKATHSQLIQSEKMAAIGLLVAGIAHEINNPIGFIKSNLSVLEEYFASLLALASSARKALDFLTEEGQNAGKKPALIADLKAQLSATELDYLEADIPALMIETSEGISRVITIIRDLQKFSHVAETEWEIVDLHAGIDSTINIANNEIRYRASVQKNYGDLPLVECIPSQINQVIMNVIVNAAQSIEASGLITIDTRHIGDQVSITITDTGRGIDPEDMAHLFEPFFTTKSVGTGTGLGLAVSYGIVKAHGGNIQITSELGIGTTVEIVLPISQHPAE